MADLVVIVLLFVITYFAWSARRPQPQPPPAQEAPPSKEAPPSIEAPKSADGNSGFPARWKSMASGTIRTLRFDGEYIYGETVLSEAAVKAGAFALMDVKKDGDKYVGKVNGPLCKARRRRILFSYPAR
jgi:hypothetical protein